MRISKNSKKELGYDGIDNTIDEKITKQILAKAFFDLMDGCNNAYDIQYSTGLQIERCEEIFDLYQELVIIGEKDRFEFNQWENV